MSLIGSTNEERIWNFLSKKGLNAYGIAGLMGNLYAESGLRPNNLQNTYEKKLGMTDDEYTKAVDNGSYGNFVRDKAGYGLAQWTYWSRKQNLYNFVKGTGKSIGDLEVQLDFLWKELSEGYKGVLNILKSAKTVLEASNAVLLQYERPANQGTSVQQKRAGYGQVYYDKYVKTTVKEETKMSNSPLVDCTVLSPNHSGKRTKKLCRITPHVVVGQLTAERIGGCFTSPSRQASCNYGIGYDGRVCLCVDEANRSWCSSSNDNDQQAVTIECASDKTHPYAIKDVVYSKLKALCIDICRRNGKTKLLWLGSKEKTLAYKPADDEMVLTAHRWFANKSCPGEWLYSRYGELANAVTAALGGSVVEEKKEENTDFPQTPFMVQVLITDLNYRSEPSMKGTVKGQTGKGSFTITQVSNGWGKLKSGVGWIYLENPEYVKIGKSTATVETPKSNVPYKVRVSITDLNIRKGPGTNYDKTGQCTGIGSFTIVEEKTGKGSTKGWGKLKSGAGWISLDYCEKV